MSTYTSATIFGGPTTISNPDELYAFAKSLEMLSQKLLASAHASHESHEYFKTQYSIMTSCPHRYTPSHSFISTLTYVERNFSRTSSILSQFSQDFHELSLKLIHSLHLYSQAEMEMEHMISTLITAGSYAFPVPMALLLGSTHAVAELSSDRSSLSGFFSGDSSTQQSFLNGFAHSVSWTGGIPGAAQKIVPTLSTVNNLYQGTQVKVTPTTLPSQLNEAHSIHDNLENLDTLASGSLGNSYATVGIQRYTHADGTHSWVVTIPGTDGQKDSPFGWTQNVELMAQSEKTRSLAQSQSAVLEAMRQAGVRPEDEVALVGHSQGGIIAASIACNTHQPYRISHIITAGSPIANHPINTTQTWVTSIETDREIVSDLDGHNNPESDHWLTIRGHITDSSPYQNSTAVPFASHKHELSHGMNYHFSTYADAEKLDSDAVRCHEDHFKTLTEGTMDKNMYFTCRMRQ